jgi:hypothetical protein
MPAISGDVRTGMDLCEVIEEVWQNLKSEAINALVAEMPRRLIEVIKRDGRTIQRI